jgi:hypothetical protein
MLIDIYLRRGKMAWYNQSWRHSLAARRIKTKLNGPIHDYTRHGIPITVRDGRVKDYPVGPSEVKKTLDKIPKKDIDGITEVNLRDPSPVPGAKQDKAWAQYVRSKKRINIFSGECPDKAYFEGYVLPHEVGHHVAAKKDPKLPIIVEEAKADAYAAKENPDSPVVLKKHINNRVNLFGNRGTI